MDYKGKGAQGKTAKRNDKNYETSCKLNKQQMRKNDPEIRK